MALMLMVLADRGQVAVVGRRQGQRVWDLAERWYPEVVPLLVEDQVVGRAEPVFDPRTRTLRLLGAWGDTSRLDEALDDLAAWLGATKLHRGQEQSCP
jgi:uncharacterized protein YcaQ